MNRTDHFLYASCCCMGINHTCFVQAQFTKIPHNYHNSPIKQIRNSANLQFSNSANPQLQQLQQLNISNNISHLSSPKFII